MRGERQESRVGRARYFTEMEAFSVALAARLLDGGVRREPVRELFEHLAGLPWPPAAWTAKPPSRLVRATGEAATAIEAVFRIALEPSTISLGDAINLRIV